MANRAINDRLLASTVIILGIAAVVVLVSVVATFVVFALQYPPNLWFRRHSLTGWAAFGSFAGSMLQALVGALAVLGGILASIIFTARSNARRDREEQTRTAIRLSEMMKDKDFYVRVVAPSWEIVSKWMHWNGPEGDAYRQEVAAGMFLDEVDALRSFSTREGANKLAYQNVIRFVPHFEPFDWNRGGQTISELSEHMVLMIWVGFWYHIYWLDQEGLVSRPMIRSLFRDWYGSWRPFMMQLRFVGDALADSPDYPTGGVGPSDTQSKTDFSRHMTTLEEILYVEDYGAAHPASVEKYRVDEIAAKEKAATIARSIVELHAKTMIDRK